MEEYVKIIKGIKYETDPNKILVMNDKAKQYKYRLEEAIGVGAFKSHLEYYIKRYERLENKSNQLFGTKQRTEPPKANPNPTDPNKFKITQRYTPVHEDG